MDVLIPLLDDTSLPVAAPDPAKKSSMVTIVSKLGDLIIDFFQIQSLGYLVRYITGKPGQSFLVKVAAV